MNTISKVLPKKVKFENPKCIVLSLAQTSSQQLTFVVSDVRTLTIYNSKFKVTDKQRLQVFKVNALDELASLERKRSRIGIAFASAQSSKTMSYKSCIVTPTGSAQVKGRDNITNMSFIPCVLSNFNLTSTCMLSYIFRTKILLGK